MKYENEMEIDVGRCLRALVKKWWFMAVMAVLFGIIGLALTLDKAEDIYEATSTVYGMSAESYSYTQVGVSAMNDYVDIATSMKVCERAVLLMGSANVTGEDVQKATTVSLGGKESKSSTTVKADSTIMTIKCESSNPVEAMEMSQAVAEAFVMEMENILGNEAVRILDKPYAYKLAFDATQNQWMIRIVAFLFGGVFAAAIIVFGEIFDTKARTIRECSLREELPVIGVIPMSKE
ncbi:MAG: hypothetical protein IJO85_07830 [Lachnospiraceae bacterium]|nr:hypothetical protein [Lachnospiraceae bacterium]